uniref:Uncharacterized protein n=1 Tax=Helianthus annuus TaxID=4232 RepID=A0A251TR35_HELAN
MFAQIFNIDFNPQPYSLGITLHTVWLGHFRYSTQHTWGLLSLHRSSSYFLLPYQYPD